MVWNQGFPASLGGSSISTNLAEAPDTRFSSSGFRRQHPCRENVVSRTFVEVTVYAWPYERIRRGSGLSPPSAVTGHVGVQTVKSI